MPVSPYATGLTALTKRSHSTAEIVNILQDKGFSNEEIDDAVTRLTQDRYLDDDRYAQNLTKTYRDRHKSALYIRHKLRERGIDEGAINNALTSHNGVGDDQDSILSILTRKYPAILDKTASHELKNKAYKYLTNSGFRIDDVTKFLRGMDHDERQ